MKSQLLWIIFLVAMIGAPMCNSSSGPSEDSIGSGNVVTERFYIALADAT